MSTNHCFYVLLLTFLLQTVPYCGAEYLNYYIEDYCRDTGDSISEQTVESSNTSIVLHSTRSGHLSSKTCTVQILVPNDIDGLIITVQNLSIVNVNQNCDDYLRFDNSPVAKWCNSSSAQSLIFPHKNITIEFTVGSNSTSGFVLAITPYITPSTKDQSCPSNASFKCEDNGAQQCIASDFHCDHVYNCPDGYDEKNCQHVNNTEIDDILAEDVQKVEYSEYYISDYCYDNSSDIKALPAILRATSGDKRLSNETCSITFEIPRSNFAVKRGLALTVQNIIIETESNSTCDDYVSISVNDEQVDTWCNTSSATALEFSGLNEDQHLTITFHAGLASATDFTLILTPFRKPYRFVKCLREFHCGDSDECISHDYVCDGFDNCINGADEAGCPNSTTTTETPKTTTEAPKTTPVPTNTTTAPTTTTPVPTTITPPPTTTSTLPPNITTTEPPTTNYTSTPVPSTTHEPRPSHMSRADIIIIIAVVIVACLVIFAVGYHFWYRRRRNVGYSPLNE